MSYGKLYGYAERGGGLARTSGVDSTNRVQLSYPLCTVTVYDAGTLNLASIFSDSAGTVKANPFTSDSYAYWEFYGNGTYDVKFSGAGIPIAFTLSNLVSTSLATGLPFINVKDAPYSMVGDGSDETSKLSAVVAAANALGGATIWFPPGNYGVTTVPSSTYADVSPLFTLLNLTGIALKGHGATITDLRTLYFSPVTCSNNGVTATVVTGSPHGFSTGNYVSITGGTVANGDDGYNYYGPVTVTGANTFTYPLPAAAASPNVSTIEATIDSVMFSFRGCTGVDVDLDFVAPRKGDYLAPRGLHFIYLENGSSNININATFDGGFAGVCPHNTDSTGHVSTATEANRCTNIRAKIKAVYTERPYYTYYSGTNCDIWIDADTCGRDFLVLGARQNDIHVTTVNQVGSTAIDAQSGVGNEDLRVWIYDHYSTVRSASNPQMILQYADTSAAIHRNIKLHFDVKYNTPSGLPFGNVLTIDKLDGTGAADTTGRGHILSGLEVSGTLDMWAGRQPIGVIGSFASPDIVTGIYFHDIVSTNAAVAQPLSFNAGNALSGEIVVERVTMPTGAFNIIATTGRVVFKDTTAYNLTIASVANRDNTTAAEYINSTAIQGTTTSFINKRIVNSKIGSIYYNPSSQGADLPSANPIQPTAYRQRVTGTALIKTITMNSTAATDVYFNDGDKWSVIPTGVFTWDATGNIAVAGTAVVGRELTFTRWASLWYPSYV